MALLLTAGVSAAEGRGGDPCSDWRQRASEVMLRVVAAQSRTEEGIDLLTDLMQRHNAGDENALAAYERERQRFGQTVEEAVTAGRLASQEGKRLKQLLNDAGGRCQETELHGLKWTGWWFNNHGPILETKAAFLAAARLDSPKAKSIFEEVIESSGSSDDADVKWHVGKAKGSLEVLKRGEIPSYGRRQLGRGENVKPLPSHPEWRQQSEGSKP